MCVGSRGGEESGKKGGGTQMEERVRKECVGKEEGTRDGGGGGGLGKDSERIILITNLDLPF